MPQTISDAVRSIGSRALEIAEQVIVQEAERVFSAAREQWPVSRRRKPIHSRELLHLEIARDGGRIRVKISNSAKYAWYIKGKAQGGRQTWWVLVGSPMQRAQREAAIAIAEEVARGGTS
jgi:hypothetical protein